MRDRVRRPVEQRRADGLAHRLERLDGGGALVVGQVAGGHQDDELDRDELLHRLVHERRFLGRFLGRQHEGRRQRRQTRRGALELGRTADELQRRDSVDQVRDDGGEIHGPRIFSRKMPTMLARSSVEMPRNGRAGIVTAFFDAQRVPILNRR